MSRVTEERATELAATKLRPPMPPERLVRRSRLDDLLDAGVDGDARLVLVSAPAGAGKSTLMAGWLAGRTGAVAWLQAEESDADPARFWTYLVAAVEQALPAPAPPPTANDLAAIVAGSNGDDLVVVPALVNRLTDHDGPLVVVVDDYHLVDHPDIHRGVERLVDLGPPQVTLVLATRVDPPFRLGRLRVRGRLAEVRAADLRFDAAEAPGLLGPAAGSLDPDHVDQLCGRTEGWAAGLVLAGLSLGRATDPGGFVDAFRGDDRLVVEYLRDELLATTADDDRRRLLETSILDQLHGDLVDAVTGDNSGARWLSDVAGTNQLVVGLDRTGTWYRYHHLLRDLLRLEAGQAFPERLPDLHGRAASWFEAQGDDGHAVAHRLAAGDTAAAARLMIPHGLRLLRDGQVATLRGLLEQIGDDARTSTACSLLYGWCELIAGRYARAEDWVRTALDAAPDGFDRAIATPLSINVALARGDVATALATAEPVTGADQLASHPSDLATAVGAARTWAGQADEARAALGLAVERAAAEHSRSAHVLALVYRAILEHEAGASVPRAHAAASAAIATAEGFGLASYYGIAPAFAVRARTGGDPDRARADAGHALDLARRASSDLALGFVLTACADTLLHLGDPAGAPLLEEAGAVLGRCPDPGVAGRYLARARSRHGATEPAPTRAAGLVEPLTDRELAVLRYLPGTLSQRDIAAELYVSLNTVKTHCRAIYRKLGAADRRAAVQAARDLHVL